MRKRPVHPVVSFFRVIHSVVENNAEFRRGYNASSVSRVPFPFGCCGCGMHFQIALARLLSAPMHHVRLVVCFLGRLR